MFSEGILGPGRQFFDQVVAQGHEGVVAKHLASRYLPGRRASSWRKIKPQWVIPCVIIGYLPARSGFRGLLVAAQWQGILQYAGQLTSGFTPAARTQLAPRLARRIRKTPVVPCPKRATWVQPDLYCQVRYLQRTVSGCLRGASFRRLIAPSA